MPSASSRSWTRAGVPWVTDPLARRRQERDDLLGLARTYVDALGLRLALVGAAVAGSVARGDFNQWSDIDVVVVSDDLPPDALERLTLLHAGRPGRVEPHGYTREEFRRAVARGDSLAREALELGVPLAGRLPRPH
jgi:hypothetical protein